MKLNKKGMDFGAWQGLLGFAIVMAVFGLILTITSGVQQEITDDQVPDTAVAGCGLNSTGGTGGTLLYTACVSHEVGEAGLDAQLELAQKQSTLVTAGIGIFILGLLISGFAIYKYA